MNAAEAIAAAIEKLERERTEFDADDGVIYEGLPWTLYCTIDAQLAILRRTLDDLNNLLVYPSDLDIELDLARAILGES